MGRQERLHCAAIFGDPSNLRVLHAPVDLAARKNLQPKGPFSDRFPSRGRQARTPPLPESG
jgi:hypothetical protein